MKKAYTVRTRQELAEFIKRIQGFSVERPLQFTVGFYKKRRSTSANALMWVWLNEIAHETGNDVEDLHETFKRMFLAPEEKEIFGAVQHIYTTKTLSTVDFAEYLEKISAFVSRELGITLSQPDKPWY